MHTANKPYIRHKKVLSWKHLTKQLSCCVIFVISSPKKQCTKLNLIFFQFLDLILLAHHTFAKQTGYETNRAKDLSCGSFTLLV